MGTAIEKIASQKGHTISLIVDNNDFSAEDLSDSDVAIEFTQPSACTSNIKKCFAIENAVLPLENNACLITNVLSIEINLN